MEHLFHLLNFSYTRWLIYLHNDTNVCVDVRSIAIEIGMNRRISQIISLQLFTILLFLSMKSPLEENAKRLERASDQMSQFCIEC